MTSMVDVLWFFTKYKSAEFKKKKSRRKGFTVMPFTVSRLQSHTFISKTKDEKSLSDKDQPFGNTKYLGIRYVMPGFLSSNLIPVQSRCVTV